MASLMASLIGAQAVLAGFPLSAVILGIINIVIVAAVLVLVGLLVVWLMDALAFPVPPMVRRVYIIVVALICLYMVAALLLGFPTFNVLRG